MDTTTIVMTKTKLLGILSIIQYYQHTLLVVSDYKDSK